MGNDNKISYYSSFYCYPYFHQNWNLFVPPPTNNYTLIVYNDSIKINVFNELLIKHQNNKLGGYEPILLALSNSIHYFDKNTILKSGKVTNDKNFVIVEHFVKKYLYKKTKQPLNIILIINDVLIKQNRLYYN